MGRIRARSKVTTISEVLQVAVMKMDLMGDEELKAFLSYPRHEILISENVASNFHNESLRMLSKDPGDEITGP